LRFLRLFAFYTLIANTGLFAEACREWRKIRGTDKNMEKFQELFTEAEQDRSSLLTTSSRGRKRHSSDPHYALCASSSRSTSNGTRARYGTRPSHGRRHPSANGHLDRRHKVPNPQPQKQQRHFLLLDPWSHHQQQSHQCLV
jgi:hypothetical protein